MRRLRADEPVREVPPPAVPPEPQPAEIADGSAHRRERLLAALTLIMGTGLVLAVPFALRAGAEFFMPVTAAFVIAIALVPMLEWLERRRLPSTLSALICVLLLLGVANIAIASIVLPASDWVRLIPERIGRIRATLAPLMHAYSQLQRFFDDITRQFSTVRHAPRTVAVESPNSVLDVLATAAPLAILQMFFVVLVVFFFLAGWTRMRKHTITARTSFDGAMTTARAIQQMVDATSTYLGTITLVNITLGLVTAGVLWLLGMPTPMMWGGIVTVLNYIPYLGPITSALLLAVGGLMTFNHPWYAFLPAACFIGLHLTESNLITPSIVGRRLTINPLLILVALSFWAWVWGTPGALLAVPLLIIIRTVLDAAGRPDIAGFLFEEGTLSGKPPEEGGG
ncbi:MAG TPA: AI-2E family transporter [Allosphingosinicella sp.]|jgi:predicted PurR-regulated permease PerM|nr:AI-2E family transporter [Allosphingosinicella sp.]